MAPSTKTPRPAGLLNFSYSPMSPMNWGIVPAAIDVFVFPNVQSALQALLRSANAIHIKRLENGTAQLLSEHLFFRGQSEVTANLLPTRLRGPWKAPPPRERYAIDGREAREVNGDWYERLRMRTVDEMMRDVPPQELALRDEEESLAIERASKLPDVASLDPFRQRAAVRHYGEVRSHLLDVSTNPEVAAFFATGGGSRRPVPGSIGMLWALDLNFLGDLFEMQISSAPGGEKIVLKEMRNQWGDNKKMFEEQGILPARLEMVSVALPFRRPQAQHGRFLSLLDEADVPLPAKTEFTWWSILERRSYACAFLQDGSTYENTARNITASALLPSDEPLAAALGP